MRAPARSRRDDREVRRRRDRAGEKKESSAVRLPSTSSSSEKTRSRSPTCPVPSRRNSGRVSFTVTAASGSASPFAWWSTAFSSFSTWVSPTSVKTKLSVSGSCPAAFGPFEARGHRGEEEVERDAREDVRRAKRARGPPLSGRRGAARTRRSGRRRARRRTRPGSRAGRRRGPAARAPRRRPGRANTRWSSSVAAQRYSPRSRAARACSFTAAAPPIASTYFAPSSAGGSGSRFAGLPSYQPK